jgi:hypothetical protein
MLIIQPEPRGRACGQSQRVRALYNPIIILGLCLALLVPAATCLADQAKMDASVEAIIAGDAHMETKAYQKAVDAYRLAYDIYPQPELLELIAKAYEVFTQDDASQCPNADRAWREVLRVCGDCERKGSALSKVSTVSKLCQTLAQTTPKAQAQPDLTAIPPATPQSPTWVGWTTVTLGVAAIVTGAGFHFSAASTADDLNQSDRDAYDQDVDSIENRQMGAWISYGVGSALITTAIVLMNEPSAQTTEISHRRSKAWGWSF